MGSVEAMNGFDLEAGARVAVEVALSTAATMGDERCGTEHLLFGLVATAGPELNNLTELFALDKTRVERAVEVLRHEWCVPLDRPVPDPPLSTRAELALYVKPSSGEPASVFDVLLGCLGDPRSGASSVLRHLGAKPGEVRRLAELGAARLSSAEVERLVGALDRRRDRHYGWWGPTGDAGVADVGIGSESGPSIVLAASDSAMLTLERVVAGGEGFGITLALSSTDNWLLPPRWEPTEHLIPGFGSHHEISPDVVTIDMAYDDGTIISNREPEPRFRRDVPTGGSLALLSTRRVIENRRDRRVPEQRIDSSDWWAWPIPPSGIVTIAVNWSAEAIHGVIELDANSIRGSAEALRSS